MISECTFEDETKFTFFKNNSTLPFAYSGGWDDFEVRVPETFTGHSLPCAEVKQGTSSFHLRRYCW
jgi:hypothetical protein